MQCLARVQISNTYLRNDGADVETSQINGSGVRGIDDLLIPFFGPAGQPHFCGGLPNFPADALHLVLLGHHSGPRGEADPEQRQEGRGLPGGELPRRPPPQRGRLRVGHPPQDVVDDEAVRGEAVPQRLEGRQRPRRKSREGGAPAGGGGGGWPWCARRGSTR